mgnify:CR=1 FL=1
MPGGTDAASCGCCCGAEDGVDGDEGSSLWSGAPVDSEDEALAWYQQLVSRACTSLRKVPRDTESSMMREVSTQDRDHAGQPPSGSVTTTCPSEHTNTGSEHTRQPKKQKKKKKTKQHKPKAENTVQTQTIGSRTCSSSSDARDRLAGTPSPSVSLRCNAASSNAAWPSSSCVARVYHSTARV